jgi:SAM-dependent methyltransferase
MSTTILPKSNHPDLEMALKNPIDPEILSLLSCPAHPDSALGVNAQGQLICSEAHCQYHQRAFLTVSQQPVLIDFAKSVCTPEAFQDLEDGSLLNRKRSPLTRAVTRVIWGTSRRTRSNVQQFLKELKAHNPKPTLLMVGGGAVGSASEALYQDPDVRLVSFDIYASAHTDFVADAHDIPMQANGVDGVWIQAVLEHVLEPQRVVAEIHRVLKPNGLVYAETPFMQQVHEKAYDFTRFTESGHRWLFKDFSLIDSGSILGPGTALLWSLRYFGTGLFRLRMGGELLVLLFFWVRLLDRFIPSENTSNAASSIFFMGRKAAQPIAMEEVIGFYRGVK